ncbi:MAG: hypothetical protein R3F59_35735 [Myxococcota bacterium]
MRAHLCLLRGGGAFLSPADALQLVTWFEQGVSVPRILAALERAAEARRRSRNRVPLSLVAAKRHLDRASKGWFHRDLPQMVRGGPPLMPVVRALQAQPGDAAARRALEQSLAAIAPGDDALVEALAAVRTFVEAVWTGLGDPGRDALRRQAEAELGDLLALVQPHQREPLVEETARDCLRQRYPALTAATLAELLAHDGGG